MMRAAHQFLPFDRRPRLCCYRPGPGRPRCRLPRRRHPGHVPWWRRKRLAGEA